MEAGKGALGIRSARGRFALLVVLNAFVGGMVGIERADLSRLAEDELGVASTAAALAFIATFGATKAALNLAAGALADRYGRKRVLVAGWIAGVPVPFVIMWAPAWEWILAANALLGVNQALCWSMTINMKLDLAHARERGLAVGLNEFAGYAGVALAALGAGALAARYGHRPAPYWLGAAIALLGLALSLAARETGTLSNAPRRGLHDAFRAGSGGSAVLTSASVGGLATNLKDGALWGLLPLHLAGRADAPLLIALYPAAWGLAQLATGPLSDRVGRARLAVPGLAMQAAGVALFLSPGAGAYAGALVAGIGTALAYPTLLALVSDAAPGERRASALGVYRWWRDLGYVAGALGAGLAADALGIGGALAVVAGVTLLAAVAVAAALARGAPRAGAPGARV